MRSGRVRLYYHYSPFCCRVLLCLVPIALLVKAEEMELLVHGEQDEDSDDHTFLVDSDERPRVQRRSADYDVGAYIKSCNFSLDMYPDKVIKIITPHHGLEQYPGGLNCDWEIVGSEKCHPVVVCDEIDLRQSNDCEMDQLVISDGIRGEKEFCGPGLGFSHGNKGVWGDYLYLTFRTGDSVQFSRLFKGVSCTIRCHISIRLPPNQMALPATIQQKEDSKCMCGRKYDEGNDRIVGGETAERREFPWQAALVMEGTRIPFCGGSLINSKFVLTAAHCVLDDDYKVINPSTIQVILRAHLLDMGTAEDAQEVELGQKGSIKAPGWNEKDDPSKREDIVLDVDQILIHQLYMKFAEHDSDLALLRLKKTLSLSAKETPTPVCLPKMEKAGANLTGEKGVVTGWGKAHEDAGGSTRLLQKLEVPIIEQKKCETFYAEASLKITDNMICAGYDKGQKDSCNGDSGGPLVVKIGSSWTLVGVVSFGIGCAREHRPGVYARVSSKIPPMDLPPLPRCYLANFSRLIVYNKEKCGG